MKDSWWTIIADGSSTLKNYGPVSSLFRSKYPECALDKDELSQVSYLLKDKNELKGPKYDDTIYLND